jgi:hypothetical protein
MLHDTIGRTAIAVAAAAVIAVALGSATSGQPTATAHPFPERKPAPELAEGLRWLNTDQPLSVAKLRGRFVLLDFFSPGNVACTRTLAGTGQPAASDAPASFNEPRGLSFGDGRLFVADTNNHAIRLVDPADGTTRTLAIEGLEPPMPTASQSLGDVARPGARFQVVDQRPASKPVRAKPVTTSDGLAALLRVQLEPPAGWKLNDLAAMSWELSVKGKAGPVDTSRLRGRVKLPKPSEEFAVGVPLAAAKGAVKVRLEVSAGICSNDGGECRFSSASVDIPLTAADDGEPQPAVELTLPE